MGVALAFDQILPEGVQMAKSVPCQISLCQMKNIFHICKWIFFPISNFTVIEEIASAWLADGWQHSCN